MPRMWFCVGTCAASVETGGFAGWKVQVHPPRWFRCDPRAPPCAGSEIEAEADLQAPAFGCRQRLCEGGDAQGVYVAGEVGRIGGVECFDERRSRTSCGEA